MVNFSNYIDTKDQQTYNGVQQQNDTAKVFTNGKTVLGKKQNERLCQVIPIVDGEKRPT